MSFERCSYKNLTAIGLGIKAREHSAPTRSCLDPSTYLAKFKRGNHVFPTIANIPGPSFSCENHTSTSCLSLCHDLNCVVYICSWGYEEQNFPLLHLLFQQAHMPKEIGPWCKKFETTAVNQFRHPIELQSTPFLWPRCDRSIAKFHNHPEPLGKKFMLLVRTLAYAYKHTQTHTHTHTPSKSYVIAPDPYTPTTHEFLLSKQKLNINHCNFKTLPAVSG